MQICAQRATEMDVVRLPKIWKLCLFCMSQKLASVPAQGHVLMCDHVFGIAQALQAMLRYSKTATRNLQTSA